MSQLIISLGATKKTLLSSNKIEAKNYIDTVGKPALILSENDLEIYKKDESFKHLSYHLISNVEKPTLVCIDRNGVSVSNALNATLKRLILHITIYELHTLVSPRNFPEMRATKYDESIALLKDIQKGRVDLDLERYEQEITKGTTLAFGSSDITNYDY